MQPVGGVRKTAKNSEDRQDRTKRSIFRSVCEHQNDTRKAEVFGVAEYVPNDISTSRLSASDILKSILGTKIQSSSMKDVRL